MKDHSPLSQKQSHTRCHFEELEGGGRIKRKYMAGLQKRKEKNRKIKAYTENTSQIAVFFKSTGRGGAEAAKTEKARGARPEKVTGGPDGCVTPLIFFQMFCKCFILHVTTSYLQHVFNMLKHLQKRFANVLQRFCKCFSVKRLQNIYRGVYM